MGFKLYVDHERRITVLQERSKTIEYTVKENRVGISKLNDKIEALIEKVSEKDIKRQDEISIEVD